MYLPNRCHLSEPPVGCNNEISQNRSIAIEEIRSVDERVYNFRVVIVWREERQILIIADSGS